MARSECRIVVRKALWPWMVKLNHRMSRGSLLKFFVRVYYVIFDNTSQVCSGFSIHIDYGV